MWRNFIKIALRNIAVHKGYSLIQITGLALGMGCALFALLWTQDELNHDRFYPQGERIFRVIGQGASPETFQGHARTPHSLAQALTAETSWVAGTARYHPLGPRSLVHPLGSIYDAALAAVDPSFLGLFGFTWDQPPRDRPLSDPGSLVLGQALARRLYPDGPAVGQKLRLAGGPELTVTGVLAEPPGPTHFGFEALVLLSEFSSPDFGFMDSPGVFSYVKLTPETRPDAVAQWLSSLSPFAAQPFVLQPVRDIHLHSHLQGDEPGRGDIHAVWLIIAMGFFILAAACVNFMNLVTARSGLRAREIGVRKVVGGRNRDLIFQFYGEALLDALLALMLAMMLIELALPVFNQLTGKHLESGAALMGPMLMGGLVVALVTALVAGSYPALFLSRFQPDKVLRGRWRQGPSGRLQRQLLVVVQFTFSAVLINGFFTVPRTRLDREHPILAPGTHWALTLPVGAVDQDQALIEALSREPGILGVGSMPKYFCKGFSLAETKECVVRIQPGAEESVRRRLATLWTQQGFKGPLVCRPLDALLTDRTASQERLRLFLGLFGGIALAISALGLLGLAVFMAERRVQEIGIRKVLGASVPGLLGLLLREFALWVVLAQVLAWPLTRWVLDRWIHPWEPAAALSPQIWAETLAVVLAVTLISVTHQTLRSALSNPALTLRRS